jgi:hypothetical protein
MGDFDETVEARRAERRNQLRPIEVRDPQRHPQDSAGVEVEVQTSDVHATILDLSRREAEDLLVRLVRHLYPETLAFEGLVGDGVYYISTRHVVEPAAVNGGEGGLLTIPSYYLGKWPEARLQERLVIASSWRGVAP